MMIKTMMLTIYLRIRTMTPPLGSRCS
jgi:hypothetical protein